MRSERGREEREREGRRRRENESEWEGSEGWGEKGRGERVKREDDSEWVREGCGMLREKRNTRDGRGRKYMTNLTIIFNLLVFRKARVRSGPKSTPAPRWFTSYPSSTRGSDHNASRANCFKYWKKKGQGQGQRQGGWVDGLKEHIVLKTRIERGRKKV